MKKKIILGALAAAVVAAVTLTGCGGSEGSTVPEVVPGTMEMAQLEVNGMEGLCDYLEGNGIIAGNYVDMKADLLGAVNGRKYQFIYNGTTIITEFYEFDLNNLNETGKETINSVRENGTFSILGKSVDASITTSGKYVYIYGDTSTDDVNIAQKAKAEQLIQQFEDQESTIKVAAKAK